MYKELEKFHTYSENVNATTQLKLDHYKSGLGDLITDYIKHETKPWWRRKYYHKHLSKIYKNMLNAITVEYIT